mgnify:FL=1|jgi:hypothetical protein
MRCAICDVPLPVLSADDICTVCNWHVKDALGHVDPLAHREDKVDDIITTAGISDQD